MKRNPVSLILVGIGLAALGAGCGGSRVEVKSPTQKLKVSLSLPEGWVVEGRVQADMALRGPASLCRSGDRCSA
jgi:hypothetical protein